MRNLKASAALLLLLLVPGVKAQGKESLLIGPGDLLHVQVYDTPDLDEHARVTDAGEFSLILGGSVKLAGLTPEQAGHAIEAALIRGQYMMHPRVLVTVEQYATQNVTVLGSVKSPGVYPVATTRSILDILAMAGGLNDTADRKILIQRHGSAEKVPYFVSNVASAAADTAVKVYPGDTVIVPQAGIVYALGDVSRPGGYIVDENNDRITVLQLVARAGGTMPTAVPSHARLIRHSGTGYIEISIELSKMQKGKVADIPLQPEDIIYVPYSYLRGFAANAASLAASVGSAAVYKF